MGRVTKVNKHCIQPTNCSCFSMMSGISMYVQDQKILHTCRQRKTGMAEGRGQALESSLQQNFHVRGAP